MKRSFLLASLIALIGAFGCTRGPTATADPAPEPAPATSAAAHSESDLKTLTVDEVDQLIQEKTGKSFIYDNNTKPIYAEGHLPTAMWMDFHRVTADMLPKDKAATLVFYCANEA